MDPQAPKDGMNAAYAELVRAAREVLGCLKCDPQMERTHWSFRQSSHPATHKAIMDLMAASAVAEPSAANKDPNAEENRWQPIEIEVEEESGGDDE